MIRSSLRRTSRLKRGKALAAVSRKERTRQSLWRGVKAAIRARSGGYCEVTLEGRRCIRRATETHHVIKRSHGGQHDVNGCLDICHEHHCRTDWSYHSGRLVMMPLGFGRFACEIVYGRDKFAVRQSLARK